MCPEYESKGECKVTRCPYPHYDGKKQHKRRKVSAKTFKHSEQRIVESKPTESMTEENTNLRYFIDTEGNESSSEPSLSTIDTNQQSSQSTEEKLIVTRRPKLGVLPSYIPLD